RKAATARQKRLRWTDEQKPVERQNTSERFHQLLLRYTVKVNQEIPAKNDIVCFCIEAKIRGEEVSLAKPHLFAEQLCHGEAGVDWSKIALPEIQMLAAKRVHSINSMLRLS